MRWVYEGEGERTVVQVLPATRRILGVDTVVVRDTVTRGDALVEDTFDWYAQDDDGDVWYFGEDTKEYQDDGTISTEGSWKAGVDGAEPGIIIPAKPEPGMSYRQEYYEGEAEDRGTIVALDTQAEVPAGHYKPTLMTRDENPLEPKVLEFKFFARGVGPVLAVAVSGGSDREELLSYEAG